METLVLLMAQGEGSRWEYNDRTGWEPPVKYKQWLPVNDEEVIISRTYRQISFPNIITISKGEFLKHLPKGATIHTLPEPTGSLLSGIYNSRHMWDGYDRIIVLLGDVVYSNELIEVIEGDKRPISFYGRLRGNSFTGKKARELFGLSFYGDWQDRLNFVLRELRGKLWTLIEELGTNHLIEVMDYTDDVDSPEGYEKFWERLKSYANKDDKGEL